MTEAEARKIKDPSSLPWDEPCFVFVSGRYYLGMWHMNIPRSKHIPHAGDITFQCWRFEATPLDWICTYRFRYYAGGDPGDGRDRKNWYAARISNDEPTVEKIMATLLLQLSGLAGLSFLADPPQIRPLIFKGDCVKALAILTRQKPDWMHIKVSP